MRLFVLALTLLLPGVSATTSTDTIKGNASGDPNAPLRIEIFSDFQCPACKRFHDEELPQIIRDYVVPGKAYLIYRYFPLQMHQYGRKAAELVCACAQLDKYDTAANTLFRTQDDWAKDGKLTDALAKVLTPAEIKKALTLVDSPVVQGTIDHDLNEGASLPVQGTPTLAVTYKSRRNLLTGQGALNYTLVKEYFDAILQR